MKKARKIILITLLVLVCTAMVVGVSAVISALVGEDCGSGCEGKGNSSSSERYEDEEGDWTDFY